MISQRFTPAFIAAFFITTSLLSAGCTEETSDDILNNDNSSINNDQLSNSLASLPLEDLSLDEIEGLYFMREEEKLAHDVYTTLYKQTAQTIFDNISDSEQTHTNAIKQLIDRYSLTDPVTNDSVGSFQNTTLASLYDTLVAQGSASLIDALLVGALIEEIDIIDIQTQLDTVVDNQDISLVYENLLKGSRNHLRSFVKVLAQQGVNYSPVELTQEQYDSIINSDMETQ